MRKIALAVLAAILITVLSAYGCGPKDTGPESETPPVTETEQAKPEATENQTSVSPEQTQTAETAEPVITNAPSDEVQDSDPDTDPDIDPSNDSNESEEDTGGLEIDDGTVIEIGKDEAVGGL